MIIEESSLGPGPVVSELRDLSVEGPERVSSDQQGRALPSRQSKVRLEEVDRAVAVALRVGVMLLLGRLPALQTWLGVAV